MKKVLIYSLICIASCASIYAQNLLQNGNFEMNNGAITQFSESNLNISPWKVFGKDGGFLHNDYPGQGGSFWSVKMFDNEETYLTQDFPVTASQRYKASGFSFNISGDILIDKEAIIKFDWYSDSNGEAYLSSSEIATITGGGALDTWVKFNTIVHAPANATMGRITIFTKAVGPNPAGAIGIDNLSVVELER